MINLEKFNLAKTQLLDEFEIAGSIVSSVDLTDIINRSKDEIKNITVEEFEKYIDNIK